MEVQVSKRVALPAEGENLNPNAWGGPDYSVDPNTGCWNWLKGVDPKGYGKGAFPDQNTQWAHRAYWIAANGRMPTGRHIVIDHLCRNPRCVNPKHLEAVEQATNVHRGRQSLHTMETARQVRRMVEEGYSNAAITEATGVSTQNIWWIAEDRAWREDPTAPRQPVWPKRDCVRCGEPVVGRGRRAIYCTEACRKRRFA